MLHEFTRGLTTYLDTLDWAFICQLLAINFLLNKWVSRQRLRGRAVAQLLGRLIRTRYRVFLVGSLYGLFIYTLRGYNTAEQSENLLQAYLFSVVFYSLCVEIPAGYVEKLLKSWLSETLTPGGVPYPSGPVEHSLQPPHHETPVN